MMPAMPAAIPALFPMGKYPVPQSLPAFPGWPPGAFVRCCSFASPCHYPLQVSWKFHADTTPLLAGCAGKKDCTPALPAHAAGTSAAAGFDERWHARRARTLFS